MITEVRVTGAADIMRLLHELPYEMVSKRGGPVKLALAKGARIVRDQAKANLQAAIALNGDQSTGLLLKNVISSRGKPPIGSRGERYLVRVRRKAYPNRDDVSVRKTANLLEYGSSQQPATPWLRPAVQSKGQEVIEVMTADLLRRLELLVTRLAR